MGINIFKKLHSMGILLILVPSFIRMITCIYFLGLQGLKVVIQNKTCIFHKYVLLCDRLGERSCTLKNIPEMLICQFKGKVA